MSRAFPFLRNKNAIASWEFQVRSGDILTANRFIDSQLSESLTELGFINGSLKRLHEKKIWLEKNGFPGKAFEVELSIENRKRRKSEIEDRKIDDER